VKLIPKLFPDFMTIVFLFFLFLYLLEILHKRKKKMGGANGFFFREYSGIFHFVETAAV
jgi:hypothetical protein